MAEEPKARRERERLLGEVIDPAPTVEAHVAEVAGSNQRSEPSHRRPMRHLALPKEQLNEAAPVRSAQRREQREQLLVRERVERNASALLSLRLYRPPNEIEVDDPDVFILYRRT